jgi:cell wall-associated NlpC family hydrolase
MTSRFAVIAEARALLGVRFLHQGRHPAYGLDCLGLLLVSAQRAGITLQGLSPLALAMPAYASRPDAALLEAQLEQHLERCAEPQIGDVLLLRIQGRAQHLALVTDYPEPGAVGMIHAYAPARKVVEHTYNQPWRNATHALFRLPMQD